MKSNKVLQEMAKLIAKHGMHRLRPRLKDALQEHYCVDGMYFWKDSCGWIYCTENWPPHKGLWASHNYELLDFDELARCLHSLSKQGSGYTVMYNGERVSNLDEIKKFALTKKLAGIK